MTQRRVDRIRRILEGMNGRARVRAVLQELRRLESNQEILASSISVAVNQENQRLERLGELPAFRTFRNREERGWISLDRTSSFTPGSKADEVDRLITEINRDIDAKIQERLEGMDWRTFESSFLTDVLLGLGFQDVEITQATRDGGADARVTYRRGIVEAKAIVSAKRWASKSKVTVEEVRMLRGIKGDEDTAIIITTGGFTTEAEHEAGASQNQRVVYLINGKRLVELCKSHDLGVKKIPLRELHVLDEDRYLGVEDDPEEQDQTESVPQVEPSHDSPSEAPKLKRFTDKMLSEIPLSELARLTGLRERSVRTYFSNPERRRGLAERIRADEAKREEALRLVESSRDVDQ